MTIHGITYIGHLKDEFGYFVKFDIRGIVYEYEIECFWVEKIEQIARHSEAKALQMAKQNGTLVDKGIRKEGEPNDTSRKADGRSEILPRHEIIRDTDTTKPRPDVAKPDANETIRKALAIVQGKRLEGVTGRRV